MSEVTSRLPVMLEWLRERFPEPAATDISEETADAVLGAIQRFMETGELPSEAVKTDPLASGKTEKLVEAVLISGQRRGEIIKVDLEHGSPGQEETFSDEELEMLHQALGELDQALVGVLEETKGLKDDIRSLRMLGQ